MTGRKMGPTSGRTGFALKATLGAIVALAAGSCESRFDGPYACASGFASCTTADECETLTSSDGANCGGCGQACSPGAPCMNGTCGSAPAVFVSTPSPSRITFAGGMLVWATGGQSSAAGAIESVSTESGAPFTLVAPGRANNNCGSAGPPFAIDSSHVYYTAQASSSQSQGFVVSFVSQAIDDGCSGEALDAGACTPGSGSQTTLATAATMNGCIDSLVVSDGTLYYANGNDGNTTFDGVSTGGGVPNVAPKVIASQQNGGGGGSFVVSGGSLYFPTCVPNGPCNVLGRVPVTGGSVEYSSTVDQNGGGGEAVAVADAENVYTVAGDWNCPNDNGNQDSGPDAGFYTLTGGTTVTKFPLDGGSPTVLATSHDGSQVTGAAVDSSNLYWVTSTTAWSVPLVGGTATPIAGNLWANAAADAKSAPSSAAPCNNESSVNEVSIASDGTHVYIADPSNGAIYKIPN